MSDRNALLRLVNLSDEEMGAGSQRILLPNGDGANLPFDKVGDVRVWRDPQGLPPDFSEWLVDSQNRRRVPTAPALPPTAGTTENAIPALPPRVFNLFSFVKEENPELRAIRINQVLWKVRELLRRAWKTKEARERDWFLTELRREMYRLRLEYQPPALEPVHPGCVSTVANFADKSAENKQAERYVQMQRWLSEPPARSPLEDVLYVLQVNGSSLRICKREDKCQEPTHYFISDKSEYCSASCKRAARTEAKRKWWSEHGDTEEIKRQQHTNYLARKAAKSKVKGK